MDDGSVHQSVIDYAVSCYKSILRIPNEKPVETIPHSPEETGHIWLCYLNLILSADFSYSSVSNTFDQAVNQLWMSNNVKEAIWTMSVFV